MASFEHLQGRQHLEMDGELPENLRIGVSDGFEIDCDALMSRIDERLNKLAKRDYAGEYLIAVTLEEHHALRYVVSSRVFLHLKKVRIPTTSIMNNLRPPEFCLYYQGNPVIGSDLVGELSPLIL